MENLQNEMKICKNLKFIQKEQFEGILNKKLTRKSRNQNEIDGLF